MAHRLCAEPQSWAGLTDFGGEFELDDLIGAVIDRLGPATTDVSLWTDGLLSLPVDEEVARIKTLLLTGLPAVIGACGTNEIELVVLLALHEQFGIRVACIP